MRAGRLKDKAKIAAAAERILARSGVARLFELEIGEGQFLYHFDEAGLGLRGAAAGRALGGHHLAQPRPGLGGPGGHRLPPPDGGESAFRVLKDFIELRPVFHWTEARVRAHVAVCVLAGVIEALMEADLAKAGVADPDIEDQVISPRRALRELGRIRRVTMTIGERTIERDTRHSPLQDRLLGAFCVEPATAASMASR